MRLEYRCQGCRSGTESEKRDYNNSNGYGCSCDEHYALDDEKKKRKYN